MNKARKRHPLSGSLDNHISDKDPSQFNHLRKLNQNILNYIKQKKIKYHNPIENDSDRNRKREIKEEKEEIDNKPKSQEANKRTINKYLLEPIINEDELVKKRDNIKNKIYQSGNLSFKNKNLKNINYKKRISVDKILEDKIRENIHESLEKGKINLDYHNKRLNIIDFQKEHSKEKKENIQTLFKRYYKKIKNDGITFQKYFKFIEIIKFCKSRIKPFKKLFLEKLKEKLNKPQINLIKKSLNYHKPIIKQKRKKESSTSLEQISCFFLPSEDEEEVISLKEEYLERNLQLMKDEHIFFEVEISKEMSFHLRGRKYKRKGSDEILKFKRLYEMAEESLNKVKNESKIFRFLDIRKKVNNLNFPSTKPSSFKEIQIDYLEHCQLTIEGIKINLEIENNNNFQINSLKKNPYLWANLPITLKKLVGNHYLKTCGKYFFITLYNISLENKQEEMLMKILKNKDLKIKKHFFREFNFKIRMIKCLEEKEREKISNFKESNEILFDIEKDIYDPSFLSDSFSELRKRKYSLKSFKSSKLKLNKKIYKLDYISKQRKPKLKVQRSSVRSRFNIMKHLKRKERNRHRKLNYIDRKDSRNSIIMNSSRRYKPVKLVKKVYDNITGNIIQLNMRRSSDIYNHSEEINEYLLTNEEIKAEEILDEDITMKMKRVLKQNELSHYFRHWKSVVHEKNKKPKFFDVINIMMKCLFTDNIYVKAAFMGELFFIKGRHFFKWYWKTVGERKRKERKNKLRK